MLKDCVTARINDITNLFLNNPNGIKFNPDGIKSNPDGINFNPDGISFNPDGIKITEWDPVRVPLQGLVGAI